MAYVLTITDAGLAALVNAQKNGTTPVIFETVQFGTGKYTPTGQETALQASFKTLDTIQGGAVGDNIIHVTVSDFSAEAYTVYEAGIFTDDGVLFAVISQDTPLAQKAAGSQLLMSFDLVLEQAGETDIELGNTNFFNPPATTTTAGIVRMATAAEVEAGLLSGVAVSPAGLKAKLEKPGSLNGSAFQDGSIGLGKLSEKPVSTAEQTLTPQEQQQARENMGLTEAGTTQLIIASSPRWYKRPNLPTVAKTSVTIHANTQVNIGNAGYISTTDTTLQLSTVGEAAARAGKDVYIYACKPTSGSEPVFVLSLNSTVPTGYNAQNSRKIGGFHCLCASVGTISGHTLSGYAAGDILPLSVWDLLHRPVSEPEGMVWIEGLGIWVDIYLGSYNGSKLVSAYGALTADGSSSPAFHGEKFAEYAGLVGKRLVRRDEFIVFAKGSNEETSISGGVDPNTTGGHVDTAGRRMISNYGIEDCCGALWQWTSDVFDSWDGHSATWRTESNSETYTEGEMRYYLDGYSWKKESVFNPAFDSTGHGSCFGLLRRGRVGARWGDGSVCGSRAASLYGFSSYGWAANGCRLSSEPRVVNL